MSLSRMENTTFAMPSIIDSHRMRLRTVFTVQMPKGKRLFNAYSKVGEKNYINPFKPLKFSSEPLRFHETNHFRSSHMQLYEQLKYVALMVKTDQYGKR
ncbi:hypothetical protein TNCV_2089871 [Trichonephila clavipes]|nr:hypothetical protein TNCV_2089871 [Trichonephila clavipes]